MAASVGERLNQAEGGLTCVGQLNPGFGAVDEMSSSSILERINSTEADLLTVFLSAKKAQHWLLKNRDRLDIPVRAQFGATINLQAGKVKRAPHLMRRLGFEWLWRIKEEPYLWRRYYRDGCGLLLLVLTQVIPLVLENLFSNRSNDRLNVTRTDSTHSVFIKLSGPAVACHVGAAIEGFRDALSSRKPIVIDLSGVTHIDPRFFGLLMMCRKVSTLQSCAILLVNPSPRIRKKFQRSGFGFLLSK